MLSHSLSTSLSTYDLGKSRAQTREGLAALDRLREGGETVLSTAAQSDSESSGPETMGEEQPEQEEAAAAAVGEGSPAPSVATATPLQNIARHAHPPLRSVPPSPAGRSPVSFIAHGLLCENCLEIIPVFCLEISQ